jgi:hypothetical protein
MNRSGNGANLTFEVLASDRVSLRAGELKLCSAQLGDLSGRKAIRFEPDPAICNA